MCDHKWEEIGGDGLSWFIHWCGNCGALKYEGNTISKDPTYKYPKSAGESRTTDLETIKRAIVILHAKLKNLETKLNALPAGELESMEHDDLVEDVEFLEELIEKLEDAEDTLFEEGEQ